MERPLNDLMDMLKGLVGSNKKAYRQRRDLVDDTIEEIGDIEREIAKNFLHKDYTSPGLRAALENLIEDLDDFADIEQQCEKLFDQEILKACTEVFDPKDYKNACKVDLCANPGPETKSEILKNYIHDCTDMRDDNELKCSWFNTIPGKI